MVETGNCADHGKEAMLFESDELFAVGISLRINQMRVPFRGIIRTPPARIGTVSILEIPFLPVKEDTVGVEIDFDNKQ
jgi:hypothetical protein